MAAPESSRLNLAAKLAETAAELQQSVSQRRARASDAALVVALDHVESAARELARAVHVLTEWAEDGSEP